MTTLVLLSGGLDSTVLATKISQETNHDAVGMGFFYHQRHYKELDAGQSVAEFLKIPYVIINVPDLFKGSSSPLIDQDESMPHMTYKELAETPGVSPTYVPNRNALFISMGVAYALAHGISEVAIATHAEDSRNWAYPDCTPEFNGAMSAAVYIGTYMKVRLSTPFQWLMKREIVNMGYWNSAPFFLSWSCYEGGEKACGKCPTCVERLQAFKDAGLVDPIDYEGDINR
jgi:7-cyano-7-deazaguanine synthase